MPPLHDCSTICKVSQPALHYSIIALECQHPGSEIRTVTYIGRLLLILDRIHRVSPILPSPSMMSIPPEGSLGTGLFCHRPITLTSIAPVAISTQCTNCQGKCPCLYKLCCQNVCYNCGNKSFEVSWQHIRFITKEIGKLSRKFNSYFCY